ncbi:MAG TPA: DUF192 domain-containing protein [Candidatus Acidoferrum sp.]|nr:DUF192 domain-containing protein [Candidatus Acidoferrum sp.]
MKFFSFVMVGALALLAACNQSQPSAAPAPPTAPPSASALPYLTNAQPRLQTIKLYVGPETLATELALTPQQMATGMMWRTNMPNGEAMLFAFSQPHRVSFYMKNTRVPLSAAYIDPSGVIQEIHDLHPHKEEPVEASSDNIQFVLEVPQGWFKRRNISTGAVVRTQFGEMKRSFTFSPTR